MNEENSESCEKGWYRRHFRSLEGIGCVGFYVIRKLTGEYEALQAEEFTEISTI